MRRELANLILPSPSCPLPYAAYCSRHAPSPLPCRIRRREVSMRYEILLSDLLPRVLCPPDGRRAISSHVFCPYARYACCLPARRLSVLFIRGALRRTCERRRREMATREGDSHASERFALRGSLPPRVRVILRRCRSLRAVHAARRYTRAGADV